MKNQALTITLAILLAMALSAITALVVSSEVVGGSQTITAEPAATLILETPAEAAAPAAPVAPAPQPAAPAAPAPSVDEDVATAPAEDIATDTDEAPSTDAPTDTEDTEDTPVDPGDDDAPVEPTDDEDDNDADAPVEDEDDDDDDADAPVVPEDDVNEDDDISILCNTGYELVDDGCVFVGCPLGMILNDVGACEVPVLINPCPEGQTRLANGVCFPDLVVVIPDLDIDPTCLAGFTVVDGACVPVCPEGHTYVGGFCLPEINVDPAEFNPDFVLDLDLVGS